jgi:hypothetical protein
MVQITKNIQKRFNAEDEFLTKLYDKFEVGVPQEGMSIKKACEITGMSDGQIAAAIIVLDDLGVVGREMRYDEFQKMNVIWTLLVSRKEAWQTLQSWHQKVADSPVNMRYPKHQPRTRRTKAQIEAEKNGRTAAPILSLMPEQVTVADEPATEGEELVAVAGPERESPFTALRGMRKDESKALVEAARQYANKGKFLEDKIAELRAEGFEVAEGALTIKRDERLEAVALAVPYVESLERLNERLLGQAESGRTAHRELEDLRNNYTRLQRTHERMLAEKATTVSGR